jgi:hypothetical protein
MKVSIGTSNLNTLFFHFQLASAIDEITHVGPTGGAIESDSISKNVFLLVFSGEAITQISNP